MKRMVFSKYTEDKLLKDVKDSIKRYEQLHSSKSDALREGKIILPDILLGDGTRLDLNKFVRERGGRCIMVGAGQAIGTLYLQKKHGENKTLFHVHKVPLDMVRPTNKANTFYFVERGEGIRLDARGLWEANV
jgi:hypothetical protein